MNYKIEYETIVLGLFLSLTLFSCSKQRIEKPLITENTINENLLDFVSLNDYFTTKKIKPEQINNMNYSSANTKYIWGNKLSFSNGTMLNFSEALNNTNCELIELYTIKDYIYYNKQAVSNNHFLSMLLMYNIKIYKNNEELILVEEDPGIEFRKDIGEHNMLYHTFYENNNTWEETNYLYENDGSNMQFPNTDWVCIATKNDFATTSYTNITFTSNKYDLTNVGIYIVFSDKNTFTRVKNLKSIDLPVGEQAKLVAFGITEEGQLYSYQKNITIGEQENYEINLYKTTENNLTLLLDDL